MLSIWRPASARSRYFSALKTTRTILGESDEPVTPHRNQIRTGRSSRYRLGILRPRIRGASLVSIPTDSRGRDPRGPKERLERHRGSHMAGRAEHGTESQRDQDARERRSRDHRVGEQGEAVCLAAVRKLHGLAGKGCDTAADDEAGRSSTLQKSGDSECKVSKRRS